MKISRAWLQTFFDKPLPEASALADALTFHAFEIESVEKHGNDDVLDVKVTPNRGHDCLSHRGIAKELSAILNLPLSHDPFAAAELAGSFTMDAPVSVTIDNPELCPRYIGWCISGVKVGPSPAWLKERLEAIGERSINNVVDATNFVMFNVGQPLHAFDARKLKSQGNAHAIAVRNAKAGEKMTALDGKEYECAESTLLIVDAVANTPIGIAGIKGGAASGIDESTTNIILESANFNGVSIRKTSQALKLRTDASERFQQVLSAELCAYGIRAAAHLILEIAGGELSGFADVYPKSQQKKEVTVFTPQINDILGTKFFEADIIDVLTRLGLPFEKKNGSLVITVPFERLDIEIPEDIAEEIARIVGYDKIPAVELSPFPSKPEINKNFYASEHVREELISQGFSEVFTSVFADKGERVVANKVDGTRPYLRDSLLTGLKDAVAKNVLNRIENVNIFEIGTVWKGGEELVMVGQAGKDGVPHEKILAVPKKIAHEYLNFPLTETLRYEPFSKYPFIVRDIALWIPDTDEARGELILSIFPTHTRGLLRNIILFDQFKKDGKNSLAFHLVLQSFEKTLTDEEANAMMKDIYAAVKEKGWEVR